MQLREATLSPSERRCLPFSVSFEVCNAEVLQLDGLLRRSMLQDSLFLSVGEDLHAELVDLNFLPDDDLLLGALFFVFEASLLKPMGACIFLAKLARSFALGTEECRLLGLQVYGFTSALVVHVLEHFVQISLLISKKWLLARAGFFAW